MGYPVPAIQTTIIARLRARATLRALLTGATAPEWGVFDADGVPTNYIGNYIVTFPITNQSGEDLSFGTDAMDTYQQVSIYTMSRGFAEARAIAAEIKDEFDQKALNLSASGFNQYLLIFENDQELPDGTNQHIPMRFKLQTQG
jgi:Protein of unknown function (DUF3168)